MVKNPCGGGVELARQGDMQCSTSNDAHNMPWKQSKLRITTRDYVRHIIVGI